MRRLCLSVALIGLAALPARANDSMAATAIGGLTLQKTDAIRMDTEDLFISQEEVRVRYQFTNTSKLDIETMVAFPLPDFEASPIVATPNYRDDLKFRTLIDGQPAQLNFVEQALFKGRDVSQQLRNLRLPVMPVHPGFDEAMKLVAPQDIQNLLKAGLIENIGDEKTPEYLPKWNTRTTVTRRQVFPAGKTITVEHSYVPMAGGSVGGAFNREYRRQPEFQEKRKQYCIDDDFIRGFDARYARVQKTHYYAEVWLGYVLKTGANWAGPIGDFRLVIDKGSVDNLISFCGTGVKKIGPTQFEVRYQNFVPREDLNILIVKFGPK